MAATWSPDKRDDSGALFLEATLNSSNTTTDIQTINPSSKVSLTIKYDTGSEGNADSISVLISTASTPAAANMVTEVSSITADYSNTFDGPISAIQISSNGGSDTHSIYVEEVQGYFGR